MQVPLNLTDNKVSAPTTKVWPLFSLLLKHGVIREVESSETSGIVLKPGDPSDWQELMQLSTMHDNTPDLLHSCSPSDFVKKNRFSDIHPFKENRFNFQNDNTRYINASVMLDSPLILAQGPLHKTTEDFWEMVWDSGARAIVMTTDLEKKGKNLCQYYWPIFLSMSLKDSPKTISKTGEEIIRLGDFRCTVRTFTLTKEGEKRTVRQYQIEGWSHLKAHPSLELLFETIKKIDSENGNSSPLIIHGSAGVGRSGTFLCCHLLYQLQKHCLEQNTAFEIDVFLPHNVSAFSSLRSTFDRHDRRAIPNGV